MTILSSPINGARVAPREHTVADARPPLSRAPEWPRLTRREMRQIVLDLLG
ncbi:hypothetical protein [Azospirillum sp. sgz301742]